MRPRRGNGGARRGGALVEFAMVLPVVMLLLFATIEFASIFYVRHNMVKAARAGARAAAVQDGTVEQARAIVERNLEDIPNVNFTISIRVPPDGAPDDRDVTVEVTAPIREAALVRGNPFGLLNDAVIRSSVTMRKEG